MNTENSSNMHTTLGVLSLIVGILGFIGSFIPCLGMYAIYAGIGGLCCGIGAVNLAKKANAGTGLATAGIIISLFAAFVALWQMDKLGAI